jgi:hypothetical protein
MPQDITWKVREHSHTDKGSDWFWAVGIVVVSSAVVAFLFKNFLFALLLVIGGFTLGLLSSKPPRELTFSLTPRGVMIDRSLYPYQMLAAFWIKGRDSESPTLIIDAQRFLTPHLIASLEGVDAERVHTYLSQYLPEEEMDEPFGQRVLELFGF